MQVLKIHKLGPIEDCELKINDTMVLTGKQASGKSTIAKSIFFFKNIRKLLELQMKKILLPGNGEKITLKNRLIKAVRVNFLQIFGSTWCMDKEMSLEYTFSKDISVKVSLKDDEMNPNYIWIGFSEALTEKLDKLNETYLDDVFSDEVFSTTDVHDKVCEIFSDTMDVVYIPAGRSMLTLFSNQLNYIYSVMDDEQKRELDYCTQNYLETILKMKSFFSKDIKKMIYEAVHLTGTKANQKVLQKAYSVITDILQGEYKYIDGEERLQISEGRYVKINFASSGQQEAVWILNVLFYHLLNNKKTYFIIEEPESHLFPDAQKKIIEFISLVQKEQNQVLITTHSPYVLGTMNNLLYANEVFLETGDIDVKSIVDENYFMQYEMFSGYYVESGKIQNCMDDEFRQIKNEVIDGASCDINNDYDALVAIKYKGDECDSYA